VLRTFNIAVTCFCDPICTKTVSELTGHTAVFDEEKFFVAARVAECVHVDGQ